MERNSSRFVLMLAVSSALLACQTPRVANKLRIASAPAPLLAPQGTALAPIGATTATLQNLVGQATFGLTPMSDAVVSVKDPFTGKVLGGGNTDNKGLFSVPIGVQPTNGLFQIVVSNSAGTVQAIEGVERPASSAYQLADVEPANGITVDWGSTVVAQTLGPKLVELSLADSDSTRHFGLLARFRSLAIGLKGKGDAASISAFRAQALATPAFRDALSSIVSEINSEIVSIFRSGQGAVFQIKPFSLPEAELSISGPAITIDKVAGIITVVMDGKTETIQRSALTLNVVPLNVLTDSASLLGSPTTSLSLPGAVGPLSSSGDLMPAGSQENVTAAAEQTSARTSGGSSRRSSGGNRSGGGSDASGPSKHDMAITEVLLAENGLSILGPDAPAALSYQPQGSPIQLTIKGKLNAEHPPKIDEGDYSYPNFPFEGLIQQTFVDSKPLRRVVLDDSILLPLASNSVASDSQLELQLNTVALTDLAISGLHRVSVIDRESEAVAEIRVANPSPAPLPRPDFLEAELVGSLKFKSKPVKPGAADTAENFGGNGNQSPHSDDQVLSPEDADSASGQDIESEGLQAFTLADVEVDEIEVESGETEAVAEDGGPKYLRIVGRNLPVSIYAHWAQINGVRVYAHATWVTNETVPKTVLFLHLPEGFVQKPTGENTLSYANPFGFKFFAF